MKRHRGCKTGRVMGTPHAPVKSRQGTGLQEGDHGRHDGRVQADDQRDGEHDEPPCVTFPAWSRYKRKR
jgi:hypothetical protein